MKKLIAAMMVLVMIAAVAAAATAEGEAFTFRNGVTFNMDMPAVMETESIPYHEIDNNHTRGPVDFAELEYENITENGIRADLTYMFIGNCLVAIRLEYDFRDAEQIKNDLTAKYGQSASLDRAILGNGIYAVDDDGRPEGRVEAWTAGDLMVILEQDEDDINLTYVDLTAAYISAAY